MGVLGVSLARNLAFSFFLKDLDILLRMHKGVGCARFGSASHARGWPFHFAALYMKVLIQKLESREYFAGEGGWVREHEHARAFHSGAEALRCIDSQKLRPACVFYKFPNPKYDFAISYWSLFPAFPEAT